MSLASIRDDLGEVKYEEMVEAWRYIDEWNIFNMAKDLGIKFGPHDIDIERLLIFDIIKETLEENEKKDKDKDIKQ